MTHCRREQSALLCYQKDSNSKLLTRLDDVCSSLTEQIATISLGETEDKEIIFAGESLGVITLSPMLMKTDLAKAVQTSVGEDTINLSRSEARRVQRELEKFLICGREAATIAARNRHTEATKSPANRLGSPVRNRTTSSRAMSSSSNEQKRSHYHTLVSEPRPAHRYHQWHLFHTAAGELVVETGSQDDEGHILMPPLSSSLAFRISLIPTPNLSSISVTASFIKHFRTNMAPKMTRFVRSYNKFPMKSAASDYARKNDVVGLQ
jgi:hypothetical protein